MAEAIEAELVRMSLKNKTETHHQSKPLYSQAIGRRVPHAHPGVSETRVQSRLQSCPAADILKTEPGEGQKTRYDQEELQYLVVDCAGKPPEEDIDEHYRGRSENADVKNPLRTDADAAKWSVEDMQRQFDLGVDGVITDQPALARKTLDEIHSRHELERFASQIRTWLAD